MTHSRAVLLLRMTIVILLPAVLRWRATVAALILLSRVVTHVDVGKDARVVAVGRAVSSEAEMSRRRCPSLSLQSMDTRRR